ncbi:hypothetical protein PDESU_03111 [Pontiella desulfatans]|uniref:DUF4340 domain-containing protein n=1 Tax=Pontiella desulfatans TaxID=2750659 RepID=A0A6C2U3F6_PONDE|nr:DUF4340 domain-containing protein [Pontiella desulfatans]VGO14548.1 hypothetical protein PDESU_03111 [Pontiella desulfatans]
MKGRSTLVLLASIVVLGAFIWIQESWRARNPSKESRSVRLFNLDASSLESVEFKLTNSVVRFAKENGVWMAGAPETGMGRADVALIQRMVSGLNSMGKGTTITQKHLEIRGLDSAEYGFDKPTVVITASDNSGTHRWLVGRRTPLGDMVYAKLDGEDDIFTVSGKLLAMVPTSPDALRDRLLFPSEAASVRRIEIRGSAGFVQLVKDPQTGWHLQQPVAAAADPKEVQGFIEKLYRLRIEDFVADNVSDFSVYGLQGETRQISLGGGDGTSRMLVVGDDVPGRPGFVYVRRADDTSVFSLSADVLQLLNTPAQRIRDARVLELKLGDITSFSIRHGSDRLALGLDPAAGWQVVSPAWNANPVAVNFLGRLWADAVVTEFDVATNAVDPDWEFEFGSTVLGTTNLIKVFPSQGKKDGLLVQKDDDPAIYQINLPEIPRQFIDPLTYKDSKVWQLEKDGINKVSVLKANLPPQVVERQEDRSFALVETNSNLKVNASALSKLLGQLAEVKASGYIAYNPRDLAVYGLAEPALELHVGLSVSNELGRVLLVGRETAAGFYSMVKGRDVVFYLDKPVVDILSANLVVEPQLPTPVAGE